MSSRSLLMRVMPVESPALAKHDRESWFVTGIPSGEALTQGQPRMLWTLQPGQPGSSRLPGIGRLRWLNGCWVATIWLVVLL
jgi:hypothetical protein